MVGVLNIIYIFIPFVYLYLVSSTERDEGRIVKFNLWGGFLILLFYMLSLVFVEGVDKPIYLDNYLDAENYYGNYDRELLWGKLQLFLSYVLCKNEILYWLFYTIFYCLAYYKVAQKYFPFQYAGYFVLCVVSTMGFVSFGSNAIRAGFGISLLLFAFCSDNRWLKVVYILLAVGCNMPMLIPVTGLLLSKYILKKDRHCEIIWLMCLLITSFTSIVSDVMSIASVIDARANGYVDPSDGSDVYRSGFRFDFIIYTIVPILLARFFKKRLLEENPTYNLLYRTYLLVSSLWLLIIRVPYTDRFVYLAWFMIPFLLMYPLLNGKLIIKRHNTVVLLIISLYAFINLALSLK